MLLIHDALRYFQHLGSGFGIQRGSVLVQKKEPRLFQGGHEQRQGLALAAGKKPHLAGHAEFQTEAENFQLFLIHLAFLLRDAGHQRSPASPAGGKGEVFLEEDGARYELKKGDLLCLKPNTVHGGFRKSENCSFYWVHFFAEGYASLAPYRAKAADFSEAVVLFKELNHLSSLGNRELLVECKLAEFLLRLGENAARQSKLFADAAEYIRVHIAEISRAGELAEKFGYNADYLSRLFLQNSGLSLKKFIDRTRLNAVCGMLLTTSLPLKEIAALYGFESDNALIKFFTYHKRQTPGEYRNAICLSHTNNK